MTNKMRATARRSTVIAAGVATAAMLLAACGGSTGSAESSAAPAGSAAASAPAANEGLEAIKAEVASLEAPPVWPAAMPLSKPVDVKGKRVLIVPIGDAVPVIQAIRTGAEQALTKAGATAEKCDGKFNPTEVANCLKQAVDQKYDAVMTMFIDYAMVPTAFDAVTQAGIPVLVGGVAPSGGKTSDATLAFFDLSGQSAAMFSTVAKTALANQGEELKAIVLRLNDSGTTTAAGDAAIATITENCPACTAVPVDFTTPTVDKLPSAISAALVANPDANAVIASPEVYLEPAIAGVNSAGAQDRIQFYGGNGDLSGLQRVKDGKQVADSGVAPVYVGWQFVNGLMQLVAGDTVEAIADFAGGRVFTATNVADLALTPEAYFTLDWYGGDTSFEDEFLAAWSGQ